jgi:hypothetical protein
MVKVKGYRVNEPIKETKFFICNCKYGHQNCKCGEKMNIDEIMKKQNECKHEDVVFKESEILPSGYYECNVCNKISVMKEYFE